MVRIDGACYWTDRRNVALLPEPVRTHLRTVQPRLPELSVWYLHTTSPAERIVKPRAALIDGPSSYADGLHSTNAAAIEGALEAVRHGQQLERIHDGWATEDGRTFQLAPAYVALVAPDLDAVTLSADGRFVGLWTGDVLLGLTLSVPPPPPAPAVAPEHHWRTRQARPGRRR